MYDTSYINRIANQLHNQLNSHLPGKVRKLRADINKNLEYYHGHSDNEFIDKLFKAVSPIDNDDRNRTRIYAVARDAHYNIGGGSHHALILLPAVDVPSAEDIAEDIKQLQKEFDEVKFRDDKLIVTTKNITLEGVELGRFDIKFDINQIQLNYPPAVEAKAREPNRSAAGGYTHPHVNGTTICLGNHGHLVHKNMLGGRFLEFFSMVSTILATYGQDSPYVEIENWLGDPCRDCGEYFNYEDGQFECNLCFDSYCSDCFTSCEKCEYNYCGNCIRSYCSNCNVRICEDCTIECESCYESLCGGDSCTLSCGECGGTLCNNCSTACGECGTHVCKSCLEECIPCDNKICEGCLSCCNYCDNNSCTECLISCSDCGSSVCKGCLNECCHCEKQTCKDCEVACHQCEYLICADCVITCKDGCCEACQDCLEKCCHCEAEICEGCTVTCYECKYPMCGDCVTTCEDCDVEACQDCSKECPACSSKVCLDCGTPCVICKEEESDDD